MINFFEPLQWRQRIEKKQKSIELPQGFPEDAELRKTYRIARALEEDLIGYFQKLDFKIDRGSIQGRIREICDRFKSDILQSLQKEKETFTKLSKSSDRQTTQFKNIFEFAGGEKLYFSSKYTRVISEKLGHKFEEIADLSSYVFIPETQLNIKLKGVDMIVLWNNELYCAQIKTKKDTLTGSQVSRSIKELKIHPHSMFVAALDMGKSSHLSRKQAEINGIELQIGDFFWSNIGIDYLDIINEISRALREIERLLYEQ